MTKAFLAKIHPVKSAKGGVSQNVKQFNWVKNKKIPVIVEKGEDGFYIIESPVFRGCFTQGKTIDEALKNIREVIELCLEEKENQEILESYNPRELSLHNITI